MASLNTLRTAPLYLASWALEREPSLKYDKLFSLFGSTPLLQKQASDQMRHPQMTR